MRNKSQFLLSMAGAALLVIHGTVIAQERLAPTLAILPSPTLSFGVIGLGNGQTARLNVVNLVRTPPPVAISLAQIPCKVELDLYDGQGTLIKQKTVANLSFGHADFLDLARSELNTTASHVDVTGVAKVGPAQPFFCNVSATLEVYDNSTGVTTAILGSTNSSSPGLILSGIPPGPPAGQQ